MSAPTSAASSRMFSSLLEERHIVPISVAAMEAVTMEAAVATPTVVTMLALQAILVSKLSLALDVHNSSIV